LSAVTAFQLDITNNLYANPHSRSPSSAQTEQRILAVRSRILSDLFGLEPSSHADWDVVFTSGATAGARLVAETFPWSSRGGFFYLKQSHTSLVGIRGSALAAGAPAYALDLEDDVSSSLPTDGEVLFAYPAQCNATGRRISLDLCRDIKRTFPHVSVLVDAAAHLATSTLSLASLPLEQAPDFIFCSFYKLFVCPFTHLLSIS
jgi:molybdenum cofactor sulfurtransferase